MKTKQLDTRKEEVELLRNQLARALADYDNLQKRTEEEKLTWIKFATSRFAQSLLPVLDTLEAAQNHLKDGGLAIAVSQFKEILRNEGFVEINPKAGDKFDEQIAEVTEIIEGTQEKDGKIAEVVMPGWKFTSGQVVRHARVKVYKSAENAS